MTRVGAWRSRSPRYRIQTRLRSYNVDALRFHQRRGFQLALNLDSEGRLWPDVAIKIGRSVSELALAFLGVDVPVA